MERRIKKMIKEIAKEIEGEKRREESGGMKNVEIRRK